MRTIFLCERDSLDGDRMQTAPYKWGVQINEIWTLETSITVVQSSPCCQSVLMVDAHDKSGEEGERKF